MPEPIVPEEPLPLPVVCDPMPAPYCPPDLANPPHEPIQASAAWDRGQIVVSFVVTERGWSIAADPTASGSTVAARSRDERHASLTLVPGIAEVPVHVDVPLTCRGQPVTERFDVQVGAPGSAPAVTRHRR
jgi:hypothetical protein